MALFYSSKAFDESISFKIFEIQFNLWQKRQKCSRITRGEVPSLNSFTFLAKYASFNVKCSPLLSRCSTSDKSCLGLVVDIFKLFSVLSKSRLISWSHLTNSCINLLSWFPPFWFEVPINSIPKSWSCGGDYTSFSWSHPKICSESKHKNLLVPLWRI